MSTPDLHRYELKWIDMHGVDSWMVRMTGIVEYEWVCACPSE